MKTRVIMDTALPVRYAENIEEVEIKFTRGFKSGLIAYGTCARPGNIVRIKLKYGDSSKQFYKDLLKRFKKRFGEPDEYRGRSLSYRGCLEMVFCRPAKPPHQPHAAAQFNG